MKYEIANHIVKIVSEEFGVGEEYAMTKSRRRVYVYPRKAAFMLMRKYCGHTLLDISAYFGKRDHAVVWHNINDGKHMLTYDDAFATAYGRAEQRVRKLVL